MNEISYWKLYSIARKRSHWPASEDSSLPYLTLPYLSAFVHSPVRWPTISDIQTLSLGLLPVPSIALELNKFILHIHATFLFTRIWHTMHCTIKFDKRMKEDEDEIRQLFYLKLQCQIFLHFMIVRAEKFL